MTILAFAGALRAGSFNRKLLAVAVEALRGQADIDLLDLRDVPMPPYDGDIEANQGLPEGARKFKERIVAADALLICSPEYNHSIPGTLKNVIDWASRPPGNPFKGKVALLMGASPGPYGAVRGVLVLRQVLTALGVLILPAAVKSPPYQSKYLDTSSLAPSIRTFFWSERNDRALSSSCSSIRLPS